LSNFLITKEVKIFEKMYANTCEKEDYSCEVLKAEYLRNVPTKQADNILNITFRVKCVLKNSSGKCVGMPIHSAIFDDNNNQFLKINYQLNVNRPNHKAGIIQFAIPSYVELPIFFQYDCLPRWEKIEVKLKARKTLSEELSTKQKKVEVRSAPSRVAHNLSKIQTRKTSATHETQYVELPKHAPGFGRYVINTSPNGYGIPKFIPNNDQKNSSEEEKNVNKNGYGKPNLALPLQPLEVYGPFKSKLNPILLQEHNIFRKNKKQQDAVQPVRNPNRAYNIARRKPKSIAQNPQDSNPFF